MKHFILRIAQQNKLLIEMSMIGKSGERCQYS